MRRSRPTAIRAGATQCSRHVKRCCLPDIVTNSHGCDSSPGCTSLVYLNNSSGRGGCANDDTVRQLDDRIRRITDLHHSMQ